MNRIAIYKIFILIFFFTCISSCSQRICVNNVINQVDKKGLKQGTWIENDTLGRITILQYENGKKNGEIKIFHPNGRLAAKGKYKEEKKRGRWISYSEEGRVIRDINYKNDTINKLKKIIVQDSNL